MAPELSTIDNVALLVSTPLGALFSERVGGFELYWNLMFLEDCPEFFLKFQTGR